ncbi:hypothetical protein KX729_00220 [Rhizobium sp. XQZ8]|uniref:hypothetical protein n=1 Tax=Rhizobium populisoli TaxID=2859785 RepID=UPI001CA4DECD|nr:hypothetical protein [Rhizobium populisoli]MBW6419859.1 hypothetical protein [Rhizobium populisoli]
MADKLHHGLDEVGWYNFELFLDLVAEKGLEMSLRGVDLSLMSASLSSWSRRRFSFASSKSTIAIAEVPGENCEDDYAAGSGALVKN